MTIISSRSNPKVKQARALRQRKARQKAQLFLVEGIHHVGAAYEAHANIDYICYAPELLTSRFARDLIEELSGRGLPCLALTAQVFDTIASKENPQGILAVVHTQETSLHDLTPANFPWGVALVAPQDPGNLGTILRTIDAVGADGLLLLDSSVDPYHPSAVRASMGALFWHPFAEATFGEFTRWARLHQYHVYGTSAHGNIDYREISEYARPRILLMGSEREGLSEVQQAACELLIRLPMHGRISSLNLGVATGVMLYAMLARDQQGSGDDK
jgi:TrmH family RNA methyltransferase